MRCRRRDIGESWPDTRWQRARSELGGCTSGWPERAVQQWPSHHLRPPSLRSTVIASPMPMPDACRDAYQGQGQTLEQVVIYSNSSASTQVTVGASWERRARDRDMQRHAPHTPCAGRAAGSDGVAGCGSSVGVAEPSEPRAELHAIHLHISQQSPCDKDRALTAGNLRIGC